MEERCGAEEEEEIEVKGRDGKREREGRERTEQRLAILSY